MDSLSIFLHHFPLSLLPPQNRMGTPTNPETLQKARRQWPRLPPDLREHGRGAAAADRGGGGGADLRHLSRHLPPCYPALLELVDSVRKGFPLLVRAQTQISSGRYQNDQRDSDE